MIRNLASTRLEEIESRWKPAREQMAQIREGSEHGHWDWRNKIWSTESGRHRLVAIERCGDVQGLMAILSQPCPTALGVEGSPVLYVDYLEVAPWNLKGLPSPPRFLGVSTLLIAEAVRLSIDSGWQGRVGLHSLPQAERFYSAFCQMTSIGRDVGYYDLAYFEYTEEQAIRRLSQIGV